MLFDSIPVTDERARALAVAVRALDLEYRAFRVRVCERAAISSPELDAVAAIAGARRITPKGLAAATNLTTSATTALIDRLTAMGLIERVPHPTDRRSVVVELTRSGRALMTAVFQDYVSKFEALLRTDPCLAATVDESVDLLGCLAGAIASDDGERVHALSA